jgi:fumarylacetoacetase
VSSWVPGADGSGFGLENLPYGVVRDADGVARSVVRIGDQAVELAPLAHAGRLGVPAGTFDEPSLNRFLALGRASWTEVRERLTALLHADAGERVPLIPLADVTPQLPVRIGDYVDFYSSLEHAANVGRLFRPDQPDPLPANWRHLPVGYHGRAGSVVVSGTPVRRPCGLRGPADFGPERRLDVEVELGFITGPGPVDREPVSPGHAAAHIFGFVLVNDWSAREIQRFEYQPLGPFLGKSFATSVSPWIVPLEALAAARIPARPQDPEPADYLRDADRWALDVELELELSGTVVSRSNARDLYWTPTQQLAHATVNGAGFAPGDLFASGTISGAAPATQGCLLELTWGGQDPVTLADGTTRAFLEDGDTVIIRGRAGAVSLGEVTGTVLPARQDG